MHGAFYDQSRPGNDPGDGPELSCTVPSGGMAHTAHTVRLPDTSATMRDFSAIRTGI